jgi:hypothetical protein
VWYSGGHRQVKNVVIRKITKKYKITTKTCIEKVKEEGRTSKNKQKINLKRPKWQHSRTQNSARDYLFLGRTLTLGLEPNMKESQRF